MKLHKLYILLLLLKYIILYMLYKIV